MELFPNPADKQVAVKVEGVSENYRISVIDMEGREQIETTVPAGTAASILDISELASGVYVVALITNDGYVVRSKLIVR